MRKTRGWDYRLVAKESLHFDAVSSECSRPVLWHRQ